MKNGHNFEKRANLNMGPFLKMGHFLKTKHFFGKMKDYLKNWIFLEYGAFFGKWGIFFLKNGTNFEKGAEIENFEARVICA